MDFNSFDATYDFVCLFRLVLQVSRLSWIGTTKTTTSPFLTKNTGFVDFPRMAVSMMAVTKNTTKNTRLQWPFL